MTNDQLFEQCVNRDKDGIECKLGLWAVHSKDRNIVESNARHYWIQYYRDGEYDSILNGDNGDT